MQNAHAQHVFFVQYINRRGTFYLIFFFFQCTLLAFPYASHFSVFALCN